MGSFLLNKEAVFAELASSKKQDDGVLCCLRIVHTWSLTGKSIAELISLFGKEGKRKGDYQNIHTVIKSHLG